MNVVGPVIRDLRHSKSITQEQLAAQCNLLGWNISRSTLAKIESRVRCVTDIELQILSKALGVTIEKLYPLLDR